MEGEKSKRKLKPNLRNPEDILGPADTADKGKMNEVKSE